MDIIFEPQKGRPFSIEIGFFDTVLEIKEKVQKYQGIPVARQTLVFNGQPLQDDRDVEQCVLLQNSRVQLIVAPEAAAAAADHKPSPQPQPQPQVPVPVPVPVPVVVKTEPSSSPSRKIQLKINIPSSKGASVALEMDASDTVLRLKEKIHEMEPVPVNRIVVQSSGAELQDHRSLCEYELHDNTEIDVNIRPSPTGSATSTGSKRLKLMVLPKGGTKKIPVEVNASDSVKVLKEELQKLHQRLHFHLPQEGYFFIYKQNVMDDERSFRWHHVAQGDTIEIFNGSVTGGS